MILKTFCLIILIQLLASHQVFGQWSVQNYKGFSRFNKIKFRSETEGFLMGDYSLIMKTTDGGMNWSPINTGTEVFFQDFQYINDTTLIASGYHYTGAGDNLQSKVLKSTDGGNTWNVVTTFPNTQIHSQWFFDSQVGLLSGYNGILRTEDGGTSWKSVLNHGTTAIFFVNDSIGYTSELSKRLLRTEDKGQNWNTVRQFQSEIGSIYFVTDSLGFIGSHDEVYRTNDAGLSWTETEIASNQAVLSIDFISDDIGFIVSSEICPCIPEKVNFYTSISKTVDGGITWETHTIPGTLYSVDFINEQKGFVSGAGNLIMKYSGGTLDDLPLDYPWKTINSTNQEIANRNVYPNPVSNTLTIEFIDPNQFLKAELLTLDGKRIEVQQVVGQNLIELDLSLLPQGIYLLSLLSIDSRQTFKILKE